MGTILRAFSGVWAMRQDVAQALCEMMPLMKGEERGIRWAGGPGSGPRKRGVAVLKLHGMVDKRRSFMLDVFGGTSTDEFGDAFDDAVRDKHVSAILIDIDSPGGSVAGTPILSDKIYEARGAKPIIAVANSEMNSAAYWIGSAAHKVFASPDSSTGSIGVWSAAAEYSQAMEAEGVKVHVWRSAGSPHKAEFLPWQEFTKEAVAWEQDNVNRSYEEFATAVARNRGVPRDKVEASYGKGRPMDAKQALSAGLVDRIATIEEVAGKMQGGALPMRVVTASDDSLAAAMDTDWQRELASQRLASRLRMERVLT